MYPGFHAATNPNKPAIIMAGSGEQLTYQQLEENSQRLAQLFHQRGLRPGDRVALLAENHLRYYDVYWACMRSGLYIVTVNRHLAPEEAAYIVNDSGASVLITTKLMETIAIALAPMLESCPHRFMMDGISDGFEPYEEAMASQPAEPLESMPRGDQLLYSSGTTGRPKGVVRPLGGLQLDDPTAPGMGSLHKAILKMTPESVYLTPAPLYHSAGLSFTGGALALGCTTVIMEKFDPKDMLRVFQDFRITHTQMVPTMFVRLLKLPEEVRTRYDLSVLEGVVHAAAPCPIDVKRQMIAWFGPIISEYYAGTEGNGMTFINSEQWLAHPGSVGLPLMGTPHICNDEGKEVPTGESGLIYFELPTLNFEYHGDPAKTKASRHPDHSNWSALGDIGYLDEDGYLYLTDRKAFMIISGGVNIYPAEIESALVMHPKVADIAVFGLPDPEMGEFVQAVVQPADGIEPTPELAEELRLFAREHLAGYKVPRVVDFRAELPRLPTGKLYKQGVRDEYLKASK
jgi:long-chain acyl-CoA synthetase